MCILFTGIEKCQLQTVRKKFSLQRFRQVALIKIHMNENGEAVAKEVGLRDDLNKATRTLLPPSTATAD